MILFKGFFVFCILGLLYFAAGRIAEEQMTMPLFFLLGSAAFFILLSRPELTLYLIPIAISIPRTIPRLFGTIGILEALLPLAAAAWAARTLFYRRRVRLNKVLFLALLAAVPLIVSGLLGRGDQDWARAYTWLGGCLTYLLALNLAKDRRLADKMLFLIAIVTVGIMLLDYLTHAVLPASFETLSAEIRIYRKTALSIGEGNLGAAMLTIVTPVLFAYALLGNYRIRLFSVAGLIGVAILGLLLLSRTFWFGTAIGIGAQLYILIKKGRLKSNVAGLAIAVAVGFIALSLFPQTGRLTKERVVDETIKDIRMTRSIFKNTGDIPFEYRINQRMYSRTERSIVQLRASLESPFMGHGSNMIVSRFAHAMIPTAMYDYGLIFTLPLLSLLWMWLRQAFRLTTEIDSKGKINPSSLAHLGIVASIVGGIFVSDYLITTTQYLCLAFFIAGLLGGSIASAREKQEGTTT